MGVSGSKQSSRTSFEPAQDTVRLRNQAFNVLGNTIAGTSAAPNPIGAQLGPALLLSFLSGAPPSQILGSGIFGTSGPAAEPLGPVVLPSGKAYLDSKQQAASEEQSNDARNRLPGSPFTRLQRAPMTETP